MPYKNPDNANKNKKLYYREHREQLIQKSRDYRAEFPEKLALREQKRHAKRKNNPGYRDYMINYHRNRLSKAWDALFGWKPGTHRRALEAAVACDLCGEPFDSTTSGKKATDHCHSEMRFRGFVHKRCNLALGGFMDSEEICLKAAAYLKNFKSQSVIDSDESWQASEALCKSTCT